MGTCRAAYSPGQARRQQAHGEPARGRQWPDVCAEHRLPMASDPQGPAAALDRARFFDLWSWDGTLDRIHDVLYVKCREQAFREASPTAAIIDSQSVKSAEKGGLRSTLQATTRARRSRARSAISSSTHGAF